MAKAAKGATIGLLQSAARLSRTALAERLLEHGLYAGQDKLMLALSVENGQTPSQLANLLGVRPPTITKTINRLTNQGFLEKRLSQEDGRRGYSLHREVGAQDRKNRAQRIR
jgi:DNA-binding MarR family transcriptional regulator